MGRATIENKYVTIFPDEATSILLKNEDYDYPFIVSDVFKDIYFYEDENKWIDIVTYNISKVENKYKKAILLSALYQTCLIKRPFNLFHRNNLYLRKNHKKSKFSNHVTWNKNIDDYFIKFINEYNDAVFDNGRNNKALGNNVFDIDMEVDLVYLDPPYLKRGHSLNYLTMYHFLEGLTDYENWTTKIDYSVKTNKMKPRKEISMWHWKTNAEARFDGLFRTFKDSIIVFSYRDDGIPSLQELKHLLEKYKTDVKVYSKPHQYVLSPKKNNELLFIAK